MGGLVSALVVSALPLVTPFPAERVAGRAQVAIPAAVSAAQDARGGREGRQEKPPEREESEAEKEQRKRQEKKAREEQGDPHTSFVKRVLIDGVVGVENRYRRPLGGIGLHVAFLKVGSFFIGAPGVMLGMAPEWVDERTVRDGRTVVQPMLRRRATLFLTQSVSWQVKAGDYGYFYVGFVGTKRLPLLDSKWDPAFAVSFTPR